MHMMTVEPPILLFDGSFEGWLTAVFTVYEQRWQHIPYVVIHSEVDYVPSLWQSSLTIVTDEVKANRVSTKLEAVFGKGMRELLWGFLSEDPQVYRQLFNIVRYQLANPTIDVWQDITQPDVMAVTKLVQMVGRERHRMQAFVRFEHTAQDVYFARIEPDFNVLPLLSSHFADRYADQNWAIFDLKRGYGLFYAKDDPSTSVQLIVDIDEDALYHPEKLHSEQEQQYQRLWQKYFTHVNIKERRNIKLHVQYLPRRYWKYLTEKQLIK
jgi:probable DNA metabolism protein